MDYFDADSERKYLIELVLSLSFFHFVARIDWNFYQGFSEVSAAG